MRRGMSTESALVLITIFGIVLVLIAVLFRQFMGVSEKAFTDSECRASLMLTRRADLSPICSAKPQNPLPIKCARDFVSVSEDNSRVELNGKTSKAYGGTCPQAKDADNACMGEEVVAKEMARCWNMFLNGEQPVFQQLEIDEWSLISDTGTRVCFVCAELDLPSGAPKLGEYLKAKESGKNMTYYEYLTNQRAFCDPKLRQPTCWEGIANGADGHPKIEQNSLGPGRYAVVFMRRGMGSCETEKKYEGESWYQSAAAMTNTVQVVPAAEIGKQCGAVIV